MEKIIKYKNTWNSQIQRELWRTNYYLPYFKRYDHRNKIIKQAGAELCQAQFQIIVSLITRLHTSKHLYDEDQRVDGDWKCMCKCKICSIPFFLVGGGGLKNPKISFNHFSRHFRQFGTTLIFWFLMSFFSGPHLF